jgi:hypothetical protein
MEIGSDAIKNARGLAFLTSYTVGFFGGGTFRFKGLGLRVHGVGCRV